MSNRLMRWVLSGGMSVFAVVSGCPAMTSLLNSNTGGLAQSDLISAALGVPAAALNGTQVVFVPVVVPIPALTAPATFATTPSVQVPGSPSFLPSVLPGPTPDLSVTAPMFVSGALTTSLIGP
jgi:hypothetical protein